MIGALQNGASAASERSTHEGILLSIHITSNRPESFVRFLDRLEEKTNDLSSVEVAIKIDDTDAAMSALLTEEVARRRFRISYISSPLIGGFYGLWRSFDDLLKICAADAYFVVNLNDEMYFAEKGWDTRLRKYVGLFPDRIFRLRTSHNRYRNYYDFWEPGWSNDTSAIMTKRWLDLGGGWCPCNGPDTFQQSVAFYFGWLDRFDAARPYREIPVDDIEFGGAGDSIGLSDQALRRRMRGALKPWFILMSHKMQQEAARRAQLLHAHIWAEAHAPHELRVRDNRFRRRIEVTDRSRTLVLNRRGYGLSWLRISVSNALRKLNYGYYGGAGGAYRHRIVRNFSDYLCLRYAAFDNLREAYRSANADAQRRSTVPLPQRLLLGAPVYFMIGLHKIVRTAKLGARPIVRIARWGIYRPAIVVKALTNPKYALSKVHLLFMDLK
jgi:hypothetical protein